MGSIPRYELQPNSMQQVGQCLTNEQLVNKLMVPSNLIYWALLNPALGMEQSVSSPVLWSRSLWKNSLLHGPDLSQWSLVRWGNTNSRNRPRHSTISTMRMFLFPPAISPSLVPCTPCPSATPTAGVIYVTTAFPKQLWWPSRAVFISAVHRKRWGSVERIV